MIITGGDVAAGALAEAGAPSYRAVSSTEPGSFAAALAEVDPTHFYLPPIAADRASILSRNGPGVAALARHLDEIGRRRVEVQSLSDELSGAWGSGMDVQKLAVTMHRQARALASYNIDVMWSAKLVGVTAGALRQLVSAT
jgi:hypothetical protein